MPKSKKNDGKKGVTFQLVHRSQQDPLVVDENAPQRVLLPLEKKDAKKSREEQLEEENKMEWTEHAEQELAKRQEQAKLKLPSSVFASEVEEEIGMLNKAMPVSGPQLHLDPDIVAAMDDDFDYSDPYNQLEDNFIELAEGNADVEINSNFDEEEIDEVCSLPESSIAEETKSRFTNYSMTSSVIRRNEQLTLLDRRFEKMFEQYDDDKIGSLDCEVIEGYIPANSDILLQYADEFEKSQQRGHLDKHDVTQKTMELVNRQSHKEYEYIPVTEKKKWDCKTILSTYSNIYNQPRTISEPKKEKRKIDINKRTGIPNVLDCKKLTTKTLNELNEQNHVSNNMGPSSVGGQSNISQLSLLSIRPKDETPEERRERKKNLKEYRIERRKEKKLNKEAFTQETKRQVKISINNRNNVQGNKIL